LRCQVDPSLPANCSCVREHSLAAGQLALLDDIITFEPGQLCGSFAEPPSFLHFWCRSDFLVHRLCFSLFLKYGPSPSIGAAPRDIRCSTSTDAIDFAGPLNNASSLTSLLSALLPLKTLSPALAKLLSVPRASADLFTECISQEPKNLALSWRPDLQT
jgi:hypothetical protein